MAHHNSGECLPQSHKEHKGRLREEVIIFNIFKIIQSFYKEYIKLYSNSDFVFKIFLIFFPWSLKTFVNFVSLW